MLERSLVLLKPDAVRRALVGEILARFERRGFRICALRMLKLSPAMAKKHYKDLVSRPFYPELEAYITAGPLVAVILEGRQAISVIRSMIGPTDSTEAMPGTIRGDYSLDFRANVVHASDSLQSAKKEIRLFFPRKKDLY